MLRACAACLLFCQHLVYSEDRATRWNSCQRRLLAAQFCIASDVRVQRSAAEWNIEHGQGTVLLDDIGMESDKDKDVRVSTIQSNWPTEVSMQYVPNRSLKSGLCSKVFSRIQHNNTSCSFTTFSCLSLFMTTISLIRSFAESDPLLPPALLVSWRFRVDFRLLMTCSKPLMSCQSN